MILRPVAPPVEYGITKRLARAGNAAIALLRSLGTSAHVWLPGASGVSVASLPSNNYLLSDGSTGYSTVDGVDGLDLDGMGSLGSAIYSTAAAAGVVAVNGNGTVSTVGEVVTATCTVAGTYGITFANVTGALAKSYQLVFDVVTQSVVDRKYIDFGGATGLNSDDIAGANGVTRFAINVPAPATPLRLYKLSGGVGNTFSVRVISVKEYTGTHLTQATTANKPLVRRGMLNELLNSATPATQSVACIAAPYTLALYGTGNVVLSGTGAGTLTGTGASDLVVLNFTPTAGSVTFTKAGTVSSFGLFKGTFTAAQILAEGGIPTTTATAASNASAGKYWWSFDGSNDSLLSGNLGITNACTIVIAGRVNALGVQSILCEDVNGIVLYFDAAGKIVVSKVGVGVAVLTASGLIVAGVPFVVTARLLSGVFVIRLNGVQVATASPGLVFSATTGARIGTTFDAVSSPFGGALGWVVPLPTALSDADCLTVERLVGSQFPGMATF